MHKLEPKVIIDTAPMLTETQHKFTTLGTLSEEKNIPIIKRQLIDSKFSIYLVFCPKRKRHFAMKVYPFHKSKINPLYTRESRIFLLEHQNLISVVDTVNEESVSQNNENFNISYMLMELGRCDFVTLTKNKDFNKDEKLVRTYFHQLVKGVEYIHSQEIAHMDLKAETLILGEDFQLKLSDFDQCFKKGDKVLVGNGSPGFRAPELKDKICSRPDLADIYSCGILLFIMRVGCMPYLEDQKVKGFDLFQLLIKNPEKFWEAQKSFNKVDDVNFSSDFKELFFGMTCEDIEKRYTINKIKKNKWYQGETYAKTDLRERMKKFTKTEWILMESCET